MTQETPSLPQPGPESAVPELASPDVAPAPQRRARQPLWFIAGLLALGLFGFFGIRWALGYPLPFVQPALHGFVMNDPVRVPNFAFDATTGERVNLTDFRGKVVMLYFGYAYCPDVCPATLAELASAREQLRAAQRDKVQVLMITVDPERDTLDLLRDYLGYFDPTFIGLRGTPDEIAAAATPYGIFYEKHEGTAATGYLIDHTATVIVIDRDGRLRMVYPFGIRSDDIASDLRRLVRE